MTFTVTYRDKDGAKAEIEIEAASRAACVAACKARGIAPIGIREGHARGRTGGASVPSAGHGPSRQRAGRPLFRWIAVAALCVAAVGGVWWWRGREDARPVEPKASETPRAAKPLTAPKSAAKPVTTNVDPAVVEQPRKPTLKDLPPEKRDAYIAKKILDSPPDLTPSTNRAFRTGVEQVASWIFTTRLGDAAPPLPKISIRDEAHIRAILDAPNTVLDTDSDKVADAKRTVAEVKKILDEYLAKGGRVQEFFEYYHGQLREAHDIWRQNQLNMLKVLKEEPEAAPMLIQEMNAEMAERGIKPLMVPPKWREKMMLEQGKESK